LNVGCGQNYKHGWVNIDLARTADLVLDMREPIPLADGSVRMIYSEHFFEHLDYPQHAAHFLSESYRILEPGGVFSVGVPDTRWPLLDYAGVGDGQYLSAAKEEGWHPPWTETHLDHINYHFRQDGEHRYAYDFDTLRLVLHKAGFDSITQREFDPILDTPSRRRGTLYVDATRPKQAANEPHRI
jgi:predicted SAM-dependent methyltransferase